MINAASKHLWQKSMLVSLSCRTLWANERARRNLYA